VPVKPAGYSECKFHTLEVEQPQHPFVYKQAYAAIGERLFDEGPQVQLFNYVGVFHTVW
jgi:hypothetical protein